jgi:hypothetical protein
MIGKKNAIDLILPVLSHLLKDQDSDVKINLIKKISDFSKVTFKNKFIFYLTFKNKFILYLITKQGSWNRNFD